MVLRGGNQPALGIEDGDFRAGGGCIQAGDLLQRLGIAGCGVALICAASRRASPGQGLLCLRAQRLLHDLAQGEVEHRHAQEKHHHEGEEQLGEDPARHEAILFQIRSLGS